MKKSDIPAGWYPQRRSFEGTSLTPRESRVLYEYANGLRLAWIADNVRLSLSRIRQIKDKAIRKARNFCRNA